MGFAGQLFDKPGGKYSVDNIQKLQNKSKKIIKNNPLSSGRSKKAGQGAQLLRYPNKRIESSADYLSIKIVEYKPSGIGVDQINSKETNTGSTFTGKIGASSKLGTASSRASKQKPIANILLPIPQGVEDKNAVQWSDSSLNPLKALGLNMGMGLMKNPGQTLRSMVDNKGGMGQIDEQTREAIMSSLAAAAIGEDGGEIRSRASGQVLNPNMETIFKGVTIRSFQFKFTFAPRNMSEAQEVKQIIKMFKQSSAARGVAENSGNGMFISAPHVFILEYKQGNAPHPFLNKFKPCALENMGVSYTPNNTYSTYPDGTPTSMDLSLSFKELNPIYAEDYEEVGGVGF